MLLDDLPIWPAPLSLDRNFVSTRHHDDWEGFRAPRSRQDLHVAVKGRLRISIDDRVDGVGCVA